MDSPTLDSSLLSLEAALAGWLGPPAVVDRAIVPSRPSAVGCVQSRLLVHLLQVLAGVDAAPTRAKLGRGNSAVGLGRPAAHTLIVSGISVLHGPKRSQQVCHPGQLPNLT